MNPRVDLPREAIEAFCRKWLIARLELFGSALREDFREDSDVDFLVTFSPDNRWSLFDLVTMEMDLSEIVGRKVDLISRRGIEQSRNPLRRKAILESAELYYAAQ
jgi:hypothetical protein